VALSRVAPLKINGSLKNNAAILFLLDVSHFLADLLHKGAVAVDRREDDDGGI